jgi:1-acyl-sn-glycerol-3-phosphate acyltransferase
VSIAPHIHPDNPAFPGDASPQSPFGILDSLRSIALWSVGIPHLAAWTALVIAVSKIADTRRIDTALKFMSHAVPALCGVRIPIEGRERIPANRAVVYVINHVNIFDMFAIYRAIPGYARSLELAEHFSWPIFGSFITAVGQIPVDPKDPKLTAKGLKKAAEMLRNGESIVVLPEGRRTLDGSVGWFYPGAFRLAINAKVDVVPMAIHGGRTVSRRGDWRIRPGTMAVRIGHPVSTTGLTLKEAPALAEQCRQRIIELLKPENSGENPTDTP